MTTTYPFVLSVPTAASSRQVEFSEFLHSALHSLVPKSSGTVRILGQLIWFVPALALAALVWSINKSTRQTELYEFVRFSLQLLGAVTSPFKIAITMVVLIAIWISSTLPPSRLAVLMAVCGVGTVSFAAILLFGPIGPLEGLATILPCSIATCVSLAWAARAW